jgi:hypothetical protein
VIAYSLYITLLMLGLVGRSMSRLSVSIYFEN